MLLYILHLHNVNNTSGGAYIFLARKLACFKNTLQLLFQVLHCQLESVIYVILTLIFKA